VLRNGVRSNSFAVGDAIQSAASRHGKIVGRNLAVQVVQKVKNNLFETMLQCERQIHIALRDFRMRFARPPEQRFHAIGKWRARRTVPSGRICIPELLPSGLK